MVWNQVGRWLPMVLLIGCSGKLNVGDVGVAGAGVAGAGGAGAGSAGAGSAGAGGLTEVMIDPGPGGSAGKNSHGFGGDENVGGSDTGIGGSTAGSGPLPGPGSLGMACIPAITETRAEGTVAKTKVTTASHCDFGLSCGANKRCEVIPDCPKASELCVAHRPLLAESDAGGASGAGGAGGASNFGGSSTGGGPATDPVLPGVGVRDMTASATHLYWVEYGTRDSLGNYQHDGALRAYSLADGKTTTIADKLPGPRKLAITTDQAYATVDGAGIIGTVGKNQLLRLPLAGGTPTVAVDDVVLTALTSSGAAAIWNDHSNWRSATGAAAPVTLTQADWYATGVADDTHLYFFSASNGIARVPLVGGAAQPLVSPNYTFGLRGDSVYGVEPVDGGSVLDKVAKTGGAWQRIRALGDGYVYGLQVVGDRYFFASTDLGNQFGLITFSTGLVTNSDPPTRFAATYQRGQFQPVLFQATATAFFWSDGYAIYKRSLADIL